jgi:hypothetical protein
MTARRPPGGSQIWSIVGTGYSWPSAVRTANATNGVSFKRLRMYSIMPSPAYLCLFLNANCFPQQPAILRMQLRGAHVLAAKRVARKIWRWLVSADAMSNELKRRHFLGAGVTAGTAVGLCEWLTVIHIGSSSP